MNKIFLLLTCIAAQSLNASQVAECKNLGTKTINLPFTREIKSLSKQKTELSETYRVELTNGDLVHARYYLAGPLKETITCDHYPASVVNDYNGALIEEDVSFKLDQKYFYILKEIYEQMQKEELSSIELDEKESNKKDSVTTVPSHIWATRWLEPCYWLKPHFRTGTPERLSLFRSEQELSKK